MASGSEGVRGLDNVNETNAKTWSVSELISSLKFTFIEREFGLVEKVLVDREEKTKLEIDALKEKYEFAKLERMRMKEEMKVYEHQCSDLRQTNARLLEENKVMCLREKKAEERCAELLEKVKKNLELQLEKKRLEGEVEIYKQRFDELAMKVVKLEEICSTLGLEAMAATGKNGVSGSVRPKEEMHVESGGNDGCEANETNFGGERMKENVADIGGSGTNQEGIGTNSGGEKIEENVGDICGVGTGEAGNGTTSQVSADGSVSIDKNDVVLDTTISEGGEVPSARSIKSKNRDAENQKGRNSNKEGNNTKIEVDNELANSSQHAVAGTKKSPHSCIIEIIDSEDEDGPRDFTPSADNKSRIPKRKLASSSNVDDGSDDDQKKPKTPTLGPFPSQNNGSATRNSSTSNGLRNFFTPPPAASRISLLEAKSEAVVTETLGEDGSSSSASSDSDEEINLDGCFSPPDIFSLARDVSPKKDKRKVSLRSPRIFSAFD